MKRRRVKEGLLLEIFKTEHTEIHYNIYGDDHDCLVLWAHGWGQSHKSFEALIQPLTKSAQHYAIDFPGFGDSPPPSDTWSTADYADAVAEMIKSKPINNVIWVGHSFGCRVGIQIASRHPDLVKGLFLIAGAGLPRKRSPLKTLHIKARIYSYKALKGLTKTGLVSKEWLIKKFGAPDFQNASGIIRKVFVKVVNENLSPQAALVRCPTTLVYGENDTETPPEIGWRLNKLISGSEMVQLRAQDHYSVLAEGRHQVAPLLKKFIEKLSAKT